MVKNRYGDTLREGNQLIIDLIPSNYVLRIELALELKKIVNNNSELKILEFGSGEGDLTKYCLEQNKLIKIDCLDVSKEMIDLSKQFLSEFLNRITFITEDISDYLKRIDFKYDIITSSWPIHNFTWEEKKSVLEKIHSALSTNGKLLLMEKIYPDNSEEKKKLFELQIERFKHLETKLREETIAHEHQDMLDDYRMDEANTFEIMKKIGFKNIKILDRVARDVLLVAEK